MTERSQSEFSRRQKKGQKYSQNTRNWNQVGNHLGELSFTLSRDEIYRLYILAFIKLSHVFSILLFKKIDRPQSQCQKYVVYNLQNKCEDAATIKKEERKTSATRKNLIFNLRIKKKKRLDLWITLQRTNLAKLKQQKWTFCALFCETENPNTLTGLHALVWVKSIRSTVDSFEQIVVNVEMTSY